LFQECGLSGRKYSHLDVYKQSRSFAAALKQHGLKYGDVVVILLPNMPEYAAIVLGILNAGVVPSPFNPTYTARMFFLIKN
jgi:acyl-CoA synthetase (AMP-forming)/AMP-acid ligase II